MNIRQELNKKKRIVWISAYGSIALILLSSLFLPSYSKYIVPIWVAVFIFAVFYSHFGIKCLVCKGNMGTLVMYMGTPFSNTKKIQYCPFCGINIDTGINKNIS